MRDTSHRPCVAGLVIPLVCVAASALCPHRVAAQQKEEDFQPGAFHLDRLDGWIELDGWATHDHIERPRSRKVPDYRQTNTDWELDESFGLSFAGDVIHPGLVSFAGDASFGLTEARFAEHRDDERLTDSDTGYLLDYDLSLDLLKMRDISGNFTASSGEHRYPRRFQPSLRERVTTYGTTWWLKDDTFPMELSFESRDVDRYGNRFSVDDERLRESWFRYATSWVISEHHRWDLKYEHAEQEQSYQGSYYETNTRRDQVILEQDLAFGPEHQHRLGTVFRYQDEHGDLARDIFEFGPRLTLQHGPNLSTSYQYQFYHEAYDEVTVDTHRLDFQMIHQKAKNLTTTLDAFGLCERVEDDVHVYQAGAAVDFQYTRSNPLGRFNANLGLGYDTEVTRGDGGRHHVHGESGTFNDPRPVVLSRPDVEPFSVVVRDATGKRYLVRNADFIVLREGTRVLLTRVPAGRINDGDTVLIDYDYSIPAHGQVDTIRVDAGIEQIFEFGLTPYYRFSFRNEETERSTGTPLYADRTDHHRIGVQFNRDRWGGNAEFEIYDDTIDPFDAFHVSGYVQLLADPAQSLSASSSFSRFWFDGDLDRRNVSLLDLSLNWRYDPAEWLTTNTSVAYRFEDDSVQGNTHGLDLESGFELTIGDLRIELTAEYDLLNVVDSREGGVGVWLNVRRDFPNLLARR